MKLIDLNLWGGRVSKKYDEFFRRYPGTDIWCFQEVFNGANQNHHVNLTDFVPDLDLHSSLQRFLPSMREEFMQSHNEVYGLSSFLSKKLKIVEKGEVFVARGNWNDVAASTSGDKDHHRKLQWFELDLEGKRFLLVNAHLTHRPEGKKDTEKRIKQSERIIDFLGMFDCPKVLVGDFNLLPDTRSIQMIEDSGMRNLVREHGVSSTRTELYKKEHRFADYIFVSSDIIVKDFRILPDVVSDHSPLYLEFEV